MSRPTKSIFAASVALALFASACAGKQKKPDFYQISPQLEEGAALVEWFDGGSGEALARLDDWVGAIKYMETTPEAHWVLGEIAFYDGDVEKAFEQWTAVIKKAPAHPLTRFALARLYSARDEFIDFEHRTAGLFDEIDYAALSPLNRAYVSLLHQTVAFRLWNASDVAEPFSPEDFGFAARWLKTPVMSTWRLSDFDREFAPEKDATLKPEYLSPYTAVDNALNYEDVDPFWAGGITLYPSFRQSGIYYMETVANVEGDAPRDYLVYANFVSAAKVWVDGEVVFDRSEDNYETGKRYRRIRLQPGTHRVLVKLGYQSGYRDWFDMTFIPEGSARTDASGLTFTYRCVPERELPQCFDGQPANTGVKMLTDEMTPAELEPVYVDAKDVKEANDLSLWLTMGAAYYGGEHERFAAAWDELRERRPNFAAGWTQWAEEVQTLWQVPSKLRDSQALQAIRKAHELDPDSLRNKSSLSQWLVNKGEDREARAMLEEARDEAYDGDRLRNFVPLSAWASYLEKKDWNVEAEKAWQKVLEADPANCRAASKIQGALYGRSEYKPPSEITPRAADCPGLTQAWELRNERDTATRLRYAERSVGRNPLRTDYAKNLALELVRAGKRDEAMDVLKKAQRENPNSAVIASELADRAFENGDSAAALKILADYEEREGLSSWLITKRASIQGELPMSDLMPDGLAAAKKAVVDGEGKVLSNDEAYFVVDFAARRYYPDGSKLTLTHTVVRVMTKGAIDRYGEQSLPGNATPLLVRTIKQDGTVRVPEQTASKSVLSMPGLAEGDFVEVAYLQFDGPETIPSTVEGVRFFFRMADISTLHSEYVVIGDIAEFLRENNAPTAQKFTYDGLPAVRFLAKDNPRPRAEPRTVSAEEFLPWVQMYRAGETVDAVESFRRDVREQILDSSKSAQAFDEAVKEWTKGELPEAGSFAWAKEMFYRVSPLVSEPAISARSFQSDLNHIVLQKEGNTMLVLKALYDRFGVDSDVYLVKSSYQVPKVWPIREGNKYGAALLRVKTDDGEAWVSPTGPDAMFGAVNAALIGQPAVCVTCEEPITTNVPTDVRAPHQGLSVAAKLDAQGTLTGRITMELDGTEGSNLRSGLRSRTDDTSRSKLVDILASSVITGASATGYDIQNESSPDEPLRMIIDFKREGFAREVAPGKFQVETQLFRDGIASAFGGLPNRTTPMFVGFNVNNSYRLDLELEGWSSAQVAGGVGERKFESAFGQGRRTIKLDGNKLTIDASTQLGIQRIAPAQYVDFMRWALGVEQSSLTLIQLSK